VPVEKFVNTGEVLLEVMNLKKYYPIEAGFMKKQVGLVRAVDDISLYINRNETLGLVGESGCGKTTLGRCILRAVEPTSGEIYFHMEKGKPPVEMVKLDKAELQKIRKHLALVFQNPYSSLDPRMTVLQIISEPMLLSGIPMEEATIRVKELMERVGLEVKHLNRYPHAFSGGSASVSASPGPWR
jgi:peptide/nickel transport system ATP-binding protein